MAGYKPTTQLPIDALGAIARAKRKFGMGGLDAEQLALLDAYDALPSGVQSLLLRDAQRGGLDYITGAEVNAVSAINIPKASRGMLSSEFDVAERDDLSPIDDEERA